MIDRVAELLEQMKDPSIQIPKVPHVEDVFAAKLAEIEGRLTPEELRSFIELGALIWDRSTLLIPVLRLDRPDTWPSGRPIV